MAGHDINYIAISGALSEFGKKDQSPTFPVNLLGDFAGIFFLFFFSFSQTPQFLS